MTYRITHPGEGSHNVRCDICYRKLMARQCSIISDKYNRFYGLLVCDRCNIKTNPQAIPHKLPIETVPNHKLIRPSTQVFIENLNTDRLPSKPINGGTRINTLTGIVEVHWQGPLDSGSSQIIGYSITRAIPQYSFFFSINDNTLSATTTYTDESMDISLDSSYRVAAINSAGIGPYSDDIYFPSVKELSDNNYLVASQSDYVLTNGDGSYILI